MNEIPQFLIAAPTSNAGKTTVSLALMRALKNRNLGVQAFKCGPDFIDPKFHSLATGGNSYNLDMVMMPEEHIQSVFREHKVRNDVSIVEGVMGLFDGAQRSQGSSAELAKLLKIPVILVVSAKAVAYSVAPLLFGFKHFDEGLEIAGVIFNHVNSESHYRFLKEACEDVGVRTFGYLNSMKDVEIPSRHLGLSIERIRQYETSVERLAQALEDTVDLDGLLEATGRPLYSLPPQIKLGKGERKIAVAKDEAFNFIYEANIEQFKEQGEVIFFSPLNDNELPLCDLLYIPGGYPECYLDDLSANKQMLESIYRYIQNDGNVLAECGGLMYLGKAIEDVSGKRHPMVGALDIVTSMKDAKLHLGYRQIEWRGEKITGHEFHYSSLTNFGEGDVGKVTNIRDEDVEMKLYRKKGVLASYHHFYFGTKKQFRLLEKWMTNYKL